MRKWTTEPGIAEQKNALVAEFCPNAEDPAGCEVGLTTHWTEIGKVAWLSQELFKLQMKWKLIHLPSVFIHT